MSSEKTREILDLHRKLEKAQDKVAELEDKSGEWQSVHVDLLLLLFVLLLWVVLFSTLAIRFTRESKLMKWHRHRKSTRQKKIYSYEYSEPSRQTRSLNSSQERKRR